jgi:nitrile hydratase accessory protein
VSLQQTIRDEETLPRRNGELVFAAPWESRAFGVAVGLTESGVCSWDDFRARLIEQIGDWSAQGGDDPQWHYYEHWLDALERLVLESGVVTPDELAAALAAAEHAAAHEHDDAGHGHGHGHDHG